MIVSFSSRQRLHLFLQTVYISWYLRSDHVMENGRLASFSFHMCFDSSVSVTYFLFENYFTWFLYVVLSSSPVDVFRETFTVGVAFIWLSTAALLYFVFEYVCLVFFSCVSG